MRKIFIVCLAITCLCFGAAWAAESNETPAQDAEKAVGSTSESSTVGAASERADKGEETDTRWGGGGSCSASTTCPATPWRPNGYTITCQGDYDCYSIPGEVVYCDGFGLMCLF